MSGGNKHKPAEVEAEELGKSMNIELTCEIPALRKPERVWGFWLGGGEVLPHSLLGNVSTKVQN